MQFVNFVNSEDVIHCTDCKVHWGNVIVILDDLRKKNDLIWFDT